jgi:hypothetical protein
MNKKEKISKYLKKIKLCIVSSSSEEEEISQRDETKKIMDRP